MLKFSLTNNPPYYTPTNFLKNGAITISLADILKRLFRKDILDMELAGPELIFVSYPQSVFRKIRIRKILPYPPYKEFFGNRIPIRDIPYFLKQCAQALSVMNPPWLWSILFFLTLFVLGIDSVFSSVEVVNTTIADFKFENARPIRREIIALFVCVVSFGVA